MSTIALFLSLSSKRVSPYTFLLPCVATPDSSQTWSFSAEKWNAATFFLSLLNIINLFDISFLVKSMFFYHEIHGYVFESSKWGTFQSGYTNQWCNLTLAWHFWATKVCLWASKTSKICQLGCLTGQATFWKANFENYSRYSLIKWY